MTDGPAVASTPTARRGTGSVVVTGAAVLPFARELDLALQPTRSQLRAAIETVARTSDAAQPGRERAVGGRRRGR